MLDLLQWPALVVTVAAGWLVASDARPRRFLGFLLFLVSNVLWVIWGWHAGAWALVVLQAVLLVVYVRGVAAHRAQDEPLSDLERDALDAVRSRRPDADFAALVRNGVAPVKPSTRERRQAA